MNKGCNNCIAYKKEFGKPRVCVDGNTQIMDIWWEDNKHTLGSEGSVNDPDCFKPTEISILLDNMLNITEDMLSKFD